MFAPSALSKNDFNMLIWSLLCGWVHTSYMYKQDGETFALLHSRGIEPTYARTSVVYSIRFVVAKVIVLTSKSNEPFSYFTTRVLIH